MFLPSQQTEVSNPTVNNFLSAQQLIQLSFLAYTPGMFLSWPQLCSCKNKTLGKDSHQVCSTCLWLEHLATEIPASSQNHSCFTVKSLWRKLICQDSQTRQAEQRWTLKQAQQPAETKCWRKSQRPSAGVRRGTTASWETAGKQALSSPDHVCHCLLGLDW